MADSNSNAQELLPGNLEMAELAGKYLTFRLGREEYGVEILKVREIIGLMDITLVPRTPQYIRGVINLRGKIIPVIDLRAKFEMDTIKDTELTCIIVIDVERDDMVVQMGTLVDSVSEVMDILASEIEAAPSVGQRSSSNFILGVAKREGCLTILMDVEKVLTTCDVNLAKEQLEKTTEPELVG